MATLTETDYTRVASEAAESFIDVYYGALDGARNTISSFYVPSSTPENGRSLPNIAYNGEHITDGVAFQETWEKKMLFTHFDVQSVNVHVLNPCLSGRTDMSKSEAEWDMSLVMQVSGTVRLVERKEGPLRVFSDNLILVPNKVEVGGKGTGKQDEGRRWLIQGQTFRYVIM